MTRITEQESKYHDLEKMSIEEITRHINTEDSTVSAAINKVLPDVNKLITAVVNQLKNGGRLFYLGAGSGGRLSVLDAIEMPTTYGVAKGLINSVLAGGVEHLVEALEEREDDVTDGWKQLKQNNINSGDIVIGISASGTTPFVLAALQQCQKNSIVTGCIVSNPDSPIAKYANYPIEVITGPEFVSGSTRMKCGTAQKMLFDIMSTTTMIALGRVEGNRMVNVALINDKIIDRAVKMLMQKADLSNYSHAKTILMECGSVKNALNYLKNEIA